MDTDSTAMVQPADDLAELAQFLVATIPDGEAVYVSTPITTGRRFVRWYTDMGRALAACRGPANAEYESQHQANVVQPNIAEGRRIVRHVRDSIPNCVVVDPTRFHRDGLTQAEYRYLWVRVIEDHVQKVVFVDGWQFSSGCALEFLTAAQAGLEMVAEDFTQLSPQLGVEMIRDALAWYKQHDVPVGILDGVLKGLKQLLGMTESADTVSTSACDGKALQGKDATLIALATKGNIAQFVSFGADTEPSLRLARLRGCPPEHVPTTPREAIAALMKRARSGTVNVRVFDPTGQKGGQFHYGCNDKEALDHVLTQAKAGFCTIVNETIDTHDGGVSGVTLGDLVEFAPEDSPRCVEKAGSCALPRTIGIRILDTVYGFRPALDYEKNHRVEFSTHPRRQGLRGEHTIIWELEPFDLPSEPPDVRWPNRFSCFIGDKLFGLLLADSFGLRVPRTTAVTRKVGTFSFGLGTGTGERWIRTAPAEPAPGLYDTAHGWTDPFVLLQTIATQFPKQSTENPVMAILDQEAVEAKYSGAAECDSNEQLLVEGVSGEGDRYMLSQQPATGDLPPAIREDIESMVRNAFHKLGPVRIEWVHDGTFCWLVQLQQPDVQLSSRTDVIVNGAPNEWLPFETKGKSPMDLLSTIENAKANEAGVVLHGDVGILSHFGDLLRRHHVPSRIERPQG